MRRSMFAVAAAVLLLPAAAEAAPILAEQATVGGKCPQTYTIRDFRRYVGPVYERDRVSMKARKRLVHMRDCARNDRAHAWMRRWRERRARERADRQEAERLEALARAMTPHGQWAIPAYIVMCESGGRWDARNPSGAYGPYQIMPGTAAAHGCNLSTRQGHHECARKIWATQGPGAWVCA